MEEPFIDVELPEWEKQFVTDNIQACIAFLKACNFLTDNPSETQLSTQAVTLGTEIIETVQNMSFAEEEELFLESEDALGTSIEQEDVQDNETPGSQIQSETPSSEEPTSSGSFYEPEVTTFNRISLDEKIKILNIACENPNWKLKSIQNDGGTKLIRMDELARWKKEVEKGGTNFDKYDYIDKWTYERFKEHRSKRKPVYTRDIRVWAMQSAVQFQSENFQFLVSESWVIKFKRKHRIKMRKVTRYIKPSDNRPLEEILETVKEFQEKCSSEMCKYDLDFVINTDQVGCEYRVNSQRTLTDKGAKVVEAYIGDLNKVSHSYTAQYFITASGKLLPKVFVCLQEAKGVFGPVIERDVDNVVAEYGNVHVTVKIWKVVK